MTKVNKLGAAHPVFGQNGVLFFGPGLAAIEAMNETKRGFGHHRLRFFFRWGFFDLFGRGGHVLEDMSKCPAIFDGGVFAAAGPAPAGARGEVFELVRAFGVDFAGTFERARDGARQDEAGFIEFGFKKTRVKRCVVGPVLGLFEKIHQVFGDGREDGLAAQFGGGQPVDIGGAVWNRSARPDQVVEGVFLLAVLVEYGRDFDDFIAAFW